VVGLITEELGGLDVSWGQQSTVFVGHSVKAEYSLCTLTNTDDSKKKKRKKRKRKKEKVTVVRHASAPLFPPPYVSQ